jgi:hypothetical protein
MRFRSFLYLLEKIINYSLNWNWKNNLLPLANSSFSRPLSSARFGGYYRTQRNSICLDTKLYAQRSFFVQSMSIRHEVATLPIGVIPFVFSTRAEFRCIRTSVSSLIYNFLFKTFIFFLRKTRLLLQFLFYIFEVLLSLLQNRVVWW